MRQQVIQYVDDLTGDHVKAEEIKTVTVAISGDAYELDLGPKSYDAYVLALEPFRQAGRRIGKLATVASVNSERSSAVRKPVSASDREQRKAIRNWWVKNYVNAGLPKPVSVGRIPSLVLDAYSKHGGMAVAAPALPTLPKAPEKPVESARPASVGARVKVTVPEAEKPVRAARAAAKPRKRTGSAKV